MFLNYGYIKNAEIYLTNKIKKYMQSTFHTKKHDLEHPRVNPIFPQISITDFPILDIYKCPFSESELTLFGKY